MNTKAQKITFILSLVLFLMVPLTADAQGVTYYVREDGGTTSQCTGLVDAAYPGSGTNQDCAVSHIYWLLPIHGESNTQILAGGDTVIVKSGSYEMGYHGPNHPDGSSCGAGFPYGCNPKSVPSGPSPDQPTRILGEGWDQGCPNAPEFWGSERAGYLLNLQGSHNVEVRCLELTDHESCIESQGSDGCPRNGGVPLGDWATGGIKAVDSSNVLLENLNIHGLASYGIWAGRIQDWEVRDTIIRGNGFVGWNGDVYGDDDSNDGYIKFIRTTIEYSGCSEDYPIVHEGAEGIHRCWSQNQGGYGDGIGTGRTRGDWYFEDANISHNVSDGIDLLYAHEQGTVTVKRGVFEGNGGNQIKSAFSTTIEDAKIIGNCAYFVENGIHPDIVWDGGTDRSGWGGTCRALGNSVELNFRGPGQHVKIVNSTITGQGDVLINTGGSNCDGTETIELINNIIIGGNQHYHHGYTAFYYAGGANGNGSGLCGQIDPVVTDSIVFNVKNNYCPPGAFCFDPLFNGVEIGNELVPTDNDNFDVTLSPLSPAIGLGSPVDGFDSMDNIQFERGELWDLGAFEFGSCGDGVLDENEECDDGNYASGDGCSELCKHETCGDNIVQASLNEVCDGESNPCTTAEGYAGTQDCLVDCSGFGECQSNLFCGDGICSAPESVLSCITDCPYLCGDGAIHAPEECDDGNVVAGDGCSDACALEYCGDGVVQPGIGEMCDDGNTANDDGCSDVCELETGVFSLMLSDVPTRDNAVALDGLYLSAGDTYVFVYPDVGISQVRFFMDGFATQTENYVPYDLGGTNGTTLEAHPYNMGQLANGMHTLYAEIDLEAGVTAVVSADFGVGAMCGNSLVDAGEECDDGNLVNGDGCASDCTEEAPDPCGDGTCAADEDHTSCPADCEALPVDRSLMISYSSDRSAPMLLGGEVLPQDIYVFISPDEDISQVRFYLNDPDRSGLPLKTENVVPYDMGGTNGTTLLAHPYDATQLSVGAHTITAEVDNLNGTTTVVSANFVFNGTDVPMCGDGDLDDGETCDDGNTDSHDGCSASCQIEVCGDGIVHSGMGEECDDHNSISGDGCSAICEVEFCGDGVLHESLGEECDDGNGLNGDGCDADCMIEVDDPAINYELHVSNSPDRSNAVPLAGELSDNVYVFVSPGDEITNVKFYLDDPTRIGAPIRQENVVPYDFGGTNGSTLHAHPFDVSQLYAGAHSITAEILRTNGEVEIITASFSVSGDSSSDHQLMLSYSADRSNAIELGGVVNRENIYVFVSPEAGISQVRFHLNDQLLAGPAYQVENYSPYDFAGTSGAFGKPFDANQLTPGTHTITALILKGDGSEEIVGASFTVE